ncbi:MAG: threonine synthase [Aestuariivirgaceae bacterium]
MRYISTRGEAPASGFEEVLLGGPASDQGLYVPASWPKLTPEQLRALAGRSYADIAEAVMTPYTDGAIPRADFRAMIEQAYAGFGHPAVTPLKQLDANLWLLELFHGPTLAFKDIAMQLLAPMMDWALTKRGEQVTIVGATSGDTGGAAIEAFRDSRRVRLFMLHPHQRVSAVQRRQMTTQDAANIHNIAIEGTFDDAQALVKAMFADRPFSAKMRLVGVNSINWARIMAQVVYYVAAALALGAPRRAVSFAVPTGNFGDIFAGYVASMMGLPIDRLVIATNVNDILDRALRSGTYEPRSVQASISPSMDIQVSSNFERLLFETLDRDSAALRTLMQDLAGPRRGFVIPEPALSRMRAKFGSGSCSEAETAREIARVLEQTAELIDPHSAVACHVGRAHMLRDTPMIVLATAHPAKFPDAVEAASGIRPALPRRLGDLMAKKERFDVLPNDLAAVENHVVQRA